MDGIDHGGILHVNGPNVMSGYYRFENPGVLEPPESSIGPGWYDTGDVVDIDEEGFVHILGRVKRFAKIAGEMISLEVVENMAKAASPTKLHAAINMPDAQRGETILLFTTDESLTREQLRDTAKEKGIPRTGHSASDQGCRRNAFAGVGAKTDYVSIKTLAEGA